MRILHISDLHVRDDTTRDSAVVLEAFMADLARQQQAVAIDLVVFTGDIAFSGRPEEYALAEPIIKQTLAITGLDATRFILVPGNHDIDRGLIDKYEESGLRTDLNSMDAVNALLDESKSLETRLKRTSGFITFAKSFYSSNTSNVYEDYCGLLRCHEFEIDGKKIGVAALHSSWRSSGNDDQGFLIVGDRIVKAAAERLADADLVIAAMHHPVDWLAPFDATGVNLALGTRFAMLLTGHVHETSPVGITTATGEYLHSTAGSLYGDSGRTWSNSYTILDVSFASAEVRALVREYQPNREEFDAGVSVARHGESLFALAMNKGPRTGAPSGVEGGWEDFSRTRQQTLREIAERTAKQSALASIVADDPGFAAPLETLNRYIVEPYFRNQPRGLEGLRSDDQDEVATAELVGYAVRTPIIICGDQQTGLSTAVIWTLLHASDGQLDRFPVLLQESSIDAGQRGLDTACRVALRSAGVSIQYGGPLPQLVLAVDDVNQLSPKKRRRLVGFMAKNPQHQYILGCRSDSIAEIHGLLDEVHLEHSTAYIGAIVRKRLRSLVRKVSPAADEDRTMSVVMSLAGTTDFGRTPFVLGALIALAASQETVLSLKDAVDITASYAEMLLGRNDRFENSRVDLTYRNREHLLQGLAASMVKNGDQGTIERSILEEYILKYFRQLDWSMSSSYVVDDLVTRWVLFEPLPGIYAFRQKTMQAFFAAGHARENPEFRSFVLADPVRWSSIVEYLTGIPKNDEEVLRLLFETLPPRLDRTGLFERKLAPMEPEEVPMLSERAEELESEQDAGLSREELDDLVENLGRGGDASFRLSSPGYLSDDKLVEFTGHVRLLSVVLRNSELVENTSLKREIFRYLVGCWAGIMDSFGTRTMAWVINEFVEDSAQVAAELAGEPAPSGNPRRVRIEKDLIEEICVAVAVLSGIVGAVDSLGTQKLANALSALRPGDTSWDDDIAAALIITALNANLDTDDWLAYAERLLEESGDRQAVRAGLLGIAFMNLHDGPRSRRRQSSEKLVARALVRHVSFPNKRARADAEQRILTSLRSRAIIGRHH